MVNPAEHKRMRGRVRRRIGKLQDLRVQPQTLINYHKALANFMRWMDACDIGMPSKFEEMDGILQEFIEECWESGDTNNVVGNTLSALTHETPNLKGLLKGSWALLKCWQQHELPNRTLVLLRRQMQSMVR